MTEKEIRDAIPESKLSFLWDDKVTGLGCALYPSGKKAFVLYYRADGQTASGNVGPSGRDDPTGCQEAGGSGVDPNPQRRSWASRKGDRKPGKHRPWPMP